MHDWNSELDTMKRTLYKHFIPSDTPERWANDSTPSTEKSKIQTHIFWCQEKSL